ncbi:MAG: hypothetical protein ACREID_09160, partial [Planctomycetota bacterium]
MTNGTELPQGTFRAPRVPFDLKCLILATGGYLVLFLVNQTLEGWWEEKSPIGQMVNLLADEIGRIAFLGVGFERAMAGIWGLEPHGLTWWQSIVTCFLFFLVWAVFGGAILRVASLRLTRDEPLSLRQALAFGGRNLRAFLLAPVLVALFAAFFALCNVVAGLVLSVWGLGSSLLAIVLFPLVLVSSLFIILAVVGGVFGLPLMWAGIAVEQNGALEALSRAFSYIFARPLQFFFGYFLVFVLMSIVLLVGNFFESTVKNTTQAGVWRTEFHDLISTSPNEDVDVLEQPYRGTETVQRKEKGITDVRNVREARWYDTLGFLWMCGLINAFLLAFNGYALYLFLGGTASLYLQLRREVDGTEEEEIFLEAE